MKKNCEEINQKADVFMGDPKEGYTLFSTLVLLLMAIITSYRWWYMRNSLPWNYPELDTFIETAGGLIPGQG
ncbi:MAG: hypothetical protein JXJ04_17280 [Spirochaetales bacterium]|nr:hypothetical protein [Spirochaetales bacterium]